MARFLIEVPHESTPVRCAQAVEVFLKSGSHFFTHADWGCKDGEHKAWALVEADTRDEARAIVPPAFRSQAKVVQLNAFTVDEIGAFLRQYHSLTVWSAEPQSHMRATARMSRRVASGEPRNRSGTERCASLRVRPSRVVDGRPAAPALSISRRNRHQ
jgi:hypothetical protein